MPQTTNRDKELQSRGVFIAQIAFQMGAIVPMPLMGAAHPPGLFNKTPPTNFGDGESAARDRALARAELRWQRSRRGGIISAAPH